MELARIFEPVPEWLAKEEVLPFVYNVMNRQRRLFAYSMSPAAQQFGFKHSRKPFHYWTYAGAWVNPDDTIYFAFKKLDTDSVLDDFITTEDQWRAELCRDGSVSTGDPYARHIPRNLLTRPKLYWMRAARYLHAVGKLVLLWREAAERAYAPGGAGHAEVAEEFEQAAKRQRKD